MISDYFIYGLTTGQLSAADVMTAFDGDSQPYQYFEHPDDLIMAYLIQNNGIGDIVRFYELIGDAGKQRMIALNQTIMDVPISLKNAVVWATELQQAYQRRQALDALRVAVVTMQKQDCEPTSVIQQTIAHLGQIATLAGHGELAGGYGSYQKAISILDGLVSVGDNHDLDTGLPIVLTRGKLAALGGVWGCGKTALAMQMGYKIAENNVVLCIQTEMSDGDILLREAYRRCQIKEGELRFLGRKLKAAKQMLRAGLIDQDDIDQVQREVDQAQQFVLSASQYNQVKSELQTISELPVRFELSRVNAMQIMARMQAVKAEYGRIDAVIIDHVEYIYPVNKVNESEKVKEVYADLKMVMREFPDVAYLVLQHLNTAIFKSEGKNLIPSMSDFNYGGVGALDYGYIIVRPIQHLRQLKISDEQLDAMTPEQLTNLKRQAYLHVVKARAGMYPTSTALPFEYVGEYYDWRSR